MTACQLLSAVVWGNSLTKETINNMERIQKVAVSLILKQKFKTYREKLCYLELDTLENRRRLLALNFAKATLKTEYGTKMFPQNSKEYTGLIQREKYFVTKCLTK